MNFFSGVYDLMRSSRRYVLKGIALSAAGFATSVADSVIESVAAGTVSQFAGSAEKPVIVTKSRLDALAAEFHAVFNEGNILQPFSAEEQGAKYDVELRRITALTKIPETGERVKVSGLLAAPVGAKGVLPVVSWQHGTILSFEQVPSNLMRLGESGYTLQDNVDSIETLFNLQRLAGQGFALIAADYLGKGPYRNGRSEAYAVKDATVQTCVDILNAGLATMRSLGSHPSALFLNGWSQGGLNTQWLKHELQRRHIHVNAVAAQSPFNNLADSLRLWCGAVSFGAPGDVPYPPPPTWISPCLIILLGSYRQYYKLMDLFKTAIRPEHLDLAEAYWRDYTVSEDALRNMPAPQALLVDGFVERFTADLNSRFLRRLADNSTTFSTYDSPIRFYYGLADEALHPNLVKMALASGGPNMQGVPVKGASHRGTFLASLYGDGAVIDEKNTVPDWFRTALR